MVLSVLPKFSNFFRNNRIKFLIIKTTGGPYFFNFTTVIAINFRAFVVNVFYNVHNLFFQKTFLDDLTARLERSKIRKSWVFHCFQIILGFYNFDFNFLRIYSFWTYRQIFCPPPPPDERVMKPFPWKRKSKIENLIFNFWFLI